MRRKKRNGMKYRDDGISDHVLQFVSHKIRMKRPSVKIAYLIRVLRAGSLGLRSGSALGLGLGLLGRHGD
jgi:hypothetical protein